MTKIYNEVVIDMNPESTSYGETLHEDSFEYEGPMALATNTIDERIMATNHYEDHKWKWGLPIVEFSSPDGRQIKIYNEDATVILQTFDYDVDAKITDPEWTKVENRTRNWADRLTREAAPGYVADTAEVAPDINYSDIAKYIDPTTGDVINEQGMVAYMRTLPGLSGEDTPTLEAMIGEMPNMKISAADKSAAASKTASDIYGLQSGMKDIRKEASTAAGASGVYSPTSSGFGGGDTSDVYGQLGDVSTQSGNIYGLGGEKEEEFASWIKSLVGGE